jgi:NADPH:quinone reductase-like Zn-dependent oxidoreductase
MLAIPVTRFGLEHLQTMELPMPQAEPGTVLIKVHAVSLNYRDLMVAKGIYNPKMVLPRIPCSDGAGEVVAIGQGVTRVAVGDRVCGIFMQHWIDGEPTAEKSKAALGGDVDGMLAEYVALHEDGVVHFPAHLTYEEAATLPCAGVTAWNSCSPCSGWRDSFDSGHGRGFDLRVAVRKLAGCKSDRYIFKR